MRVVAVIILFLAFIIFGGLFLFVYLFDYEIKLSRMSDDEVLDLFKEELGKEKNKKNKERLQKIYTHLLLRQLETEEIVRDYKSYIKEI